MSTKETNKTIDKEIKYVYFLKFVNNNSDTRTTVRYDIHNEIVLLSTLPGAERVRLPFISILNAL